MSVFTGTKNVTDPSQSSITSISLYKGAKISGEHEKDSRMYLQRSRYFTEQPQAATGSLALTTLNLVFTVHYSIYIYFFLAKSHQSSQGHR